MKVLLAIALWVCLAVVAVGSIWPVGLEPAMTCEVQRDAKMDLLEREYLMCEANFSDCRIRFNKQGSKLQLCEHVLMAYAPPATACE